MTTNGTGLEWISLPKLNAPALAAVLGRTITQANEQKKLPADIKERLGLLEEAKAKLTGVLAQRKRKVTTDAPKTVAADKEEDRTVGALVTFLQAHAKRSTENGNPAQKALNEVFGDGTKFLTLRYEEQWGEVEARIQQLDDDGHSDAIETLGGKAFLDDLRAAHAAYGEALGITVAREGKAASPLVRRAKDEAASQLRRYVAAVVGFGSNDDKKEGCGDVVRALLAPIYEMRTRNSLRGGGAAEDEETTDDEGVDDGSGGSDGDA